MKPLYIIDNSNFCYKFKTVHSWAKVDIQGCQIDISVLVGYIKSLKSNIFHDICIVLDGIPERSLSILPSYKGTRNHNTEDKISVPHLEVLKFLTALGPKIGKNIFVVCSPKQEADQVISSITHLITGNLPSRWRFISQLNSKDIHYDPLLRYSITDDQVINKSFDFTQYDSVVIASTDADMLQLQRFPNVLVDNSTSGKDLVSGKTTDSVEYTTPFVIPIYKAIFGDISDNIPKSSSFLKKNDVIKRLNKEITSEEDLQSFAQVMQGIPNPKWDWLIKPLQREEPQAIKQMQINWKVAFLTFESIPYQLSYSNYDINTTIEKYKLRV